MSATPTPAEQGEAMGQIAEQGGPEAVSLITELMEHSSREREWIENAVLSTKDAEIARWKKRALAAEAHIGQIERRIFNVLRWDQDEYEYGAGP